MSNNQERTLYGTLSTRQRNLNGNMPGETIFGIQGPVGPQGIPGVNPHIGANGNWYVGTTDTGIPATGPVGPVGEQGIPGMTPHIGANGNWYIGSSDTGVPATGPTGPAGADGTMKFEELTDEQRETLRGPSGPAGEPGKDGVNGKDGKDGVDGKDGLSGYTPQKGVDYFTDADKAELVNAVLAAMPIAEGATF